VGVLAVGLMITGRPETYPGPVAGADEPITGRAAAAAARTAAAGTARLFSAFGAGRTVPEAGDRHLEGVPDFAARRARVAQMLLPERMAADLFSKLKADDRTYRELSKPQEMIYDGANAFIRVADRWTGFSLGDPARPRGVNDPLWPLDAPFSEHWKTRSVQRRLKIRSATRQIFGRVRCLATWLLTRPSLSRSPRQADG
jgi:hypothetical protein